MLTHRLSALLLLLSLSAYAPACSTEEPPFTDEDEDLEEAQGGASEDDNDGADDEGADDSDSRADAGGKKDAAVSKTPGEPKKDGGASKQDAGTPDADTTDDEDDGASGGGGLPGDGMCCDDGDCVCRGDEPGETLDLMGPFKVAKYSDGFRDGPQFLGATIYYPEDAEPPYSAVVFCPGFTALQSALADYGPLFASNGMVLMIIDTNTILDPVTMRALALKDALESLKAENEREGSPLQGKLSEDRYGLGGWSMGGGATWITTGDHPELKTGVTIAGHHATAGGAMMVASKVKVPTLMLAGQADTPILGGGNQSQDAYAAIPETTPKIVYEQSGVDHFGLNSPVMNKNAGHYVLAFEKTFLDGDERYRKFLLEEGPNASTWTSNIE